MKKSKRRKNKKLCSYIYIKTKTAGGSPPLSLFKRKGGMAPSPPPPRKEKKDKEGRRKQEEKEKKAEAHVHHHLILSFCAHCTAGQGRQAARAMKQKKAGGNFPLLYLSSSYAVTNKKKGFHSPVLAQNFLTCLCFENDVTEKGGKKKKEKEKASLSLGGIKTHMKKRRALSRASSSLKTALGSMRARAAGTLTTGRRGTRA